MPATSEDYQLVKQAQIAPAALKAQALTFQDDVMARVREARAARGMSMLAKQMGEVSSQLPTYGVQLRERNEGVNPLTQDQMTATARGQLLGELTSLGQQAEEQYGTIQDILNAGTNRILAQAQLAEAYNTATQGAKIPARLYNVVGDYNQVASLLNRMKANIFNLKGQTGRAKGAITWAGAKAGANPDINTYLDFQKVYASAFARGIGMESGVLTDWDIQRALAAMPSLYNTETELDEKSETIDSILNDLMFNAQSQFELGGVPFSEEYFLPTTPSTQTTSPDLAQFMSGNRYNILGVEE